MFQQNSTLKLSLVDTKVDTFFRNVNTYDFLKIDNRFYISFAHACQYHRCAHFAQMLVSENKFVKRYLTFKKS